MTLVDAQELVVAGAPFGDVYEALPTAWRFAFKEWWLRSATIPNRGVRNGKPGGCRREPTEDQGRPTA